MPRYHAELDSDRHRISYLFRACVGKQNICQHDQQQQHACRNSIKVLTSHSYLSQFGIRRHPEFEMN